MITYKPPESNLTGLDLRNYVQNDFALLQEFNIIGECYTGLILKF